MPHGSWPVGGLRARRVGLLAPPPPCVYPPACFTIASSCLSRFCSPPCSSCTWPACHFVAKFWTRFVYATPAAVIGEVVECGFEKIRRNVAKCASGLSRGERV